MAYIVVSKLLSIPGSLLAAIEGLLVTEYAVPLQTFECFATGVILSKKHSPLFYIV